MSIIKQMSEDVARGRDILWLDFILRKTFGEQYIIQVVDSTTFTAKYIGKESTSKLIKDPYIEIVDINFTERVLHYKIAKKVKIIGLSKYKSNDEENDSESISPVEHKE